MSAERRGSPLFGECGITLWEAAAEWRPLNIRLSFCLPWPFYLFLSVICSRVDFTLMWPFHLAAFSNLCSKNVTWAFDSLIDSCHLFQKTHLLHLLHLCCCSSSVHCRPVLDRLQSMERVLHGPKDRFCGLGSNRGEPAGRREWVQQSTCAAEWMGLT